MEFTRTANAGILLKIDGVSVLLDGVCEELCPYLGTPDDIRHELLNHMPDILAFTHRHPDHYDGDYAEGYQSITQRPVFEPDGLYDAQVGNVRIRAISTRHIGKTSIPHVSFAVWGSECAWIMGDASPASLKAMEDVPRPDVLVVPFAYAITASAWNMAKMTGAKTVVILHLPNPDDDEFDLWSQVKKTTCKEDCVVIPQMGQKMSISKG